MKKHNYNVTNGDGEPEGRGELGKYIRAFGSVQAEWINSIILPRLSRLERFVYRDGVPAKLQNWLARRVSKWAIVRSAEPGGHRLVIMKDNKVVETTVYLLDNDAEDGWRRV